MKDSAECDNKSVLDLSKQQLRKIPKQPADSAQHVRVLILDENELQKIDNVDSYMRIEHLSVCKNQLLRMYGVCRLHHLQQLHLAYNGILTVEGMKELTQLRHLNLEGNNIKAIEHLTTNCKLEYLNLSENSIASISDLSYLKCLKELNVQGNRITHLRQCDKWLPASLESLLLAKNGITDLNEICTLGHLGNLGAISVADNPCVQMTGNVVGFDYRPFVLNWCMTVKSIDGFAVNAIESLKAEWLYSQGRGRQFRCGEQQPLARYLSSVCPLSGEVLENENERKLRLILSKAQQHQRQLQEETISLSSMTDSCMSLGGTGGGGGGGGGGGSCNSTSSNSPSAARRRQAAAAAAAAAGQHHSHASGSRIQSPRFSRLGRQGSPDSSMTGSIHGNSSMHDLTAANSSSSSHQNHHLQQHHHHLLQQQQQNMATTVQMTSSLISNIKAHDDSGTGNIMVQSLDPHILNRSNPMCSSMSEMRSSPQHMAMLSSNFNDNMSLSRTGGSPLSAASKMVPVPESLMSPDCPPLSSCATANQHTTAATGGGGHVVQRSASTSLCASTPRKSMASKQPHDSPRSARSTAAAAAKHRIPSPVLNQTRKVHQNMMNSIQMQQQQLQREHHQLLHALPSSSVHVTPPDAANSTATNSDNEEDQQQRFNSGNANNSMAAVATAASVANIGHQQQQQEFSTDVDEEEDEEDDSSEHLPVDKLKTIRNKAAQRSLLSRPSSSGGRKQAAKQQHQQQQQQRDNRHSSGGGGKSASATKPLAGRQQQQLQQQLEQQPYNDEQISMSAILIQKLWRGHQARRQFKEAAKMLHTKRTQNYIEKLTADMETTKIALENERKIQQLQMQAINALWKKVSNMPTTAAISATAAAPNTSKTSAPTPATNCQQLQHQQQQQSEASACPLATSQSQAIVQDLAKTCSVLTSQVQQLQGSMHDILQCMTVFCQLPQQQQQLAAPAAPSPPAASTVTSMVADTQTEIVAVHTPQMDQSLPFPFRSRGQRPVIHSEILGTTPPAGRLQRPSTLPLDASIGQASEAIVALHALGSDEQEDEDGEQEEEREVEQQQQQQQEDKQQLITESSTTAEEVIAVEMVRSSSDKSC